MNKIIRKLGNSAGESLTEVLASLIVAVVAITMLASVIAASGSILDKGTDNVKSYVTASAALAEQSTGSSSGSVRLVDGSNVTVPLADAARTGIDVYYYDITDDAAVTWLKAGKVVAYRVK